MKLLDQKNSTVAESASIIFDDTDKMWVLADGLGISDPDKQFHVAAEELSPV